MKKIISLLILIIFIATPVMAKRFYFPGEKTEDQKKREAWERYEERYQKQLDYLYLKDQEDLINYKRKKRKLKLKKLERQMEGDFHYPTLKPSKGPYLKE